MNQVIQIWHHKTALGELTLGSYRGRLCLADWRYRRQREKIDKRLQKRLGASFIELQQLEQEPILTLAVEQLEQYFAAERREFDLPLQFAGSEFQQSVWQRLLAIPYGYSASYSQLAQDLGNAKAVRAVAAANGANAISIIVPCHRIVGADGSLVGYAGGLAAKQKLLALEQGTSLGQSTPALATMDLFA